MMSCRTAAGCPSCRLAADGLPSRRGERREDAPCARKSESDVHVPLPQAGHRSEPISKHPSQSRQRASRRSGRCKCGARDRTPLIIDVSPLDVGIRRVNSRQVRSSPQSERDLRAAAARPEARIARPWTGARQHGVAESTASRQEAWPDRSPPCRIPQQIRYRNQMCRKISDFCAPLQERAW